jgi:hypothetical protein
LENFYLRLSPLLTNLKSIEKLLPVAIMEAALEFQRRETLAAWPLGVVGKNPLSDSRREPVQHKLFVFENFDPSIRHQARAGYDGEIAGIAVTQRELPGKRITFQHRVILTQNFDCTLTVQARGRVHIQI